MSRRSARSASVTSTNSDIHTHYSGHALYKLLQDESNVAHIIEKFTVEFPPATSLQETFYDLLELTVEQDLVNPKKIAQNLTDIIILIHKNDPLFPAKIVDMISLLLGKLVRQKDIEKLRGDSSTRRRLYDENPRLKRCLELIQGLSVLPSEMFKLRLEPEILYVTRLTAITPQNFNRRYNQIRTSLYYKQKRFNLLREESEGFTKLITELCAILDHKDSDVGDALDTIKRLIGCFRLDGNKVLNCILISLEHAETPLEQSRMIALLKEYMSLADDGSTPGNLIAFRLDNCKAHDNEKTTLQKTSESFFRLIALLIREEIITLEQIWPKMKPENDKITSLYAEQLEAALKVACKTKINLTDDAPKVDIQEQSLHNLTTDINFTSFQKIRLVRYLISFNLYETAFGVIDCFPDLCLVSNMALRKSMFYFIQRHLTPYYNEFGNVKTVSLLRKGNDGMDIDEDALNNSGLPNNPATFFSVVLKAINYLGPFLSEQVTLLVKIIRTLMGMSKKNYGNDQISTEMLVFMQRTALPSLNLLEGNAAVAYEIWLAIEKLPFQVRFGLYKEWLSENTWKQHAALATAKTQISGRCRWLLKRLTKENFKQYGRQIGKIAHSNPGILFQIFLSQIQRYENLISPVVESLRYLTPLAFDTLAFCLMDELKDETKDRLQHDGCSLAGWLQAMAQFCGQVYKRHTMELGGLLLYVGEQLKDGKSMFELYLLQEVVYCMTGIESNGSPTNEQMEALCGGEVLRSEGGYYGQIKNFKRSSMKLREAMKVEKLEIALILLIALQRDRVLFGKSSNSESGAIDILSKGSGSEEQDLHGARLKLIGDMIDTCHGVMYQLGTFLTTSPNYTMLPADELIRYYHAPVDVAFALARKFYFSETQAVVRKKIIQLKKIHDESLPVSTEEIVTSPTEPEQNAVTPTDEMETETSTPTDSAKPSRPETPAPTEFKFDRAAVYCEAVTEALATLRLNIQTCCPDNLWSDISTEFFTTFWTLENYDMKVPINSYNREINRIKDSLKEMDSDKSSDSKSRRQRTRERERCLAKIEQIREEQKRQLRHVQCVNRRLQAESKIWIEPTKGDIITKLLQNCIFKRAVFSAEDSLYCANFILKMHEMETPNFQTLLFLDRLFTDISYTVGSLTEQQSMHYGRFLSRLLEEKITWHGSKDSFVKNCGKHPGFVTVLRQGSTTGDNTHINIAVQLDYENYRHVCNKWQYKLVRACISCLESADYVQQRNVLVILPRLLPYFPKIEGQANTLQKSVEKLVEIEKDKRQDLRVKAMGYLSLLRGQSKQLLPVEKFHLVTKKAVAKQTATKPEPTQVKEKVRAPSHHREGSKTKELSSKRDKIDRVEKRHESMERSSNQPVKKRARNDKASLDSLDQETTSKGSRVVTNGSSDKIRQTSSSRDRQPDDHRQVVRTTNSRGADSVRRNRK